MYPFRRTEIEFTADNKPSRFNTTINKKWKCGTVIRMYKGSIHILSDLNVTFN